MVKSKPKDVSALRCERCAFHIFALALALTAVSTVLYAHEAEAAEVDPAPASESCANDVVARIQTHYDSVRDLEADFVQRVRAVSIGQGQLASPEPSRGRVTFAKPGRMRWAYETPKPSVVVTDGKTLWLYDVGAREAQRMSAVSGYLNGAAFQFLLGEGDLREDFRIEAPACEGTTAEAESVVVVHLFPREASSYERLELRAHRATGEIAGTTVVDLFGNETRIDFAQIRENVDPPADGFQLQLPEGVELIDLGAAP
jgi:outer membrane lipoprotein carrier protein